MLLAFLPERENFRANKPAPSDTSEDEEKQPTDITIQGTPTPRTQHIPLKTVWKTLTNIRKWPHFLGKACVFATWSPLITYTPTIIMSLGYTRIQANALATIGNFMTLPVVLFFAWLSDRTRRNKHDPK